MSAQTDTTTDEVDQTTLEDETIASAQEAIPCPWSWGTAIVAGRFMTPIHGARAQAVKSGDAKGGKGGASASQYDYFGTIAMHFGIGPFDAILGVIEDNKSIGSWPVSRSGSAAAQVAITGRGTISFHWGVADQSPDTALQAFFAHPAYKWTGYAVGSDFLFGKGKTNSPSWQFITKRPAQQSIITGAAAALDSDNQANLATVFAEIVTSPLGLRQQASKLNTSSWQAVADSLHVSEQRELHACSPQITRQTRAKACFESWGSIPGIFCRTDSTGLIELKRWVPPADTSALLSVTAKDLLEPLEWDTGDMDSLPTDYTVEFTDRDREWKKGMERVADLASIRVEPELTTENLSCEHVVRRVQARKMVIEHQRQRRGGAGRGTASIRRQKGRQLREGDYFLVDIDPIPDANSTMLLVRCLRWTMGPVGAVRIEFQSEPNVATVQYVTPSTVTSTAAAIVVPPVVRPRVLSLKPYAGEAPSISVLAARPHPMVVGLEVLYDSDQANGSYPLIGNQTGFALPVGLAQAVATSAGTVRVKTFSTFGSGQRADFDRWLLSDGGGVSATEAADDRMLFVLLKRSTSTGNILPNGGGKALEVMSISGISLVAADTWDLSIMRGRLGTIPLAFDTSDGASFPDPFSYFEGWVVPASNLLRMGHAAFLSMATAGSTGYFRLAPWALGAAYDPTDAYDAGLQAAASWDTYSYAWPTDDLTPQPFGVPIVNPVTVHTVEVPSVSPSGGLFNTSVGLSVTAATGAVVRYSTTGDVTAASPEWPKSGGVYTTLALTSSVTLRVRAFVGSGQSDQVNLSFTKNSTTSKVASPTVASVVPTGQYGSPPLVFNFACATPGATIMRAISTDGGQTWGAYSAGTSATLTYGEQAKAYAILSGWDDSDVVQVGL